jgi:hypothetical protein
VVKLDQRTMRPTPWTDQARAVTDRLTRTMNRPAV